MKINAALCFVVLTFCIINFSQASNESRRKRSISLEMCPENFTAEQCQAYAVNQSKSLNHCHRYILAGNTIEWQSCGTVDCGESLVVVEEDLSKPYPDCCKRCAVA